MFCESGTFCFAVYNKKELIINYEDYEEKIVVFVHAYLFSKSIHKLW